MNKNSKSSPTALVTGGAGFIGSHLVQGLEAQGARVFVVDDLSTGLMKNLAHLPSNSKVEVIRGKAGSTRILARVMPECDWVFHHAAIASVIASITDPRPSHDANLQTTFELLESAVKNKIKKFIFASSSAVYGDTPSKKKRETDPVAPLSPYGLQKYASERYCQLYAWQYGLPTVAFRYFNVFGPRQRADSPYSGVIAKFSESLRVGGPLTIFGDGRQTRDFVHVTDIVRANLLAAQSSSVSPGSVFNVGRGVAVSLLDLIRSLERIHGGKFSSQHLAPRPGDVRHSCAEISMLKTQLSFAPSVDLVVGLREMVAGPLHPDAR